MYDPKTDQVLEIGHEVKLRPTPHADRFAVFERSLNSRLALIPQPEKGASNKSELEGGEFMGNESGLVQVASHYSLDETTTRLQSAFAEKGLQVFALIDHSGEAEKVGLKMRPAKVVIVGSPKAGTPLMVAAPSLAIDLPLKALVAEDAVGKVSVTYNDPAYLKERHGVPEELIKNLAGAGVVIGKAVE
ncbi:MAG TPA: DUF302 domain-containing protein [Candidatus Sulfotelmatobacter sp.]